LSEYTAVEIAQRYFELQAQQFSQVQDFLLEAQIDKESASKAVSDLTAKLVETEQQLNTSSETIQANTTLLAEVKGALDLRVAVIRNSVQPQVPAESQYQSRFKNKHTRHGKVRQ
jgi:predicted  nucleic acid-binding Zn-ribbon protein